MKRDFVYISLLAIMSIIIYCGNKAEIFPFSITESNNSCSQASSEDKLENNIKRNIRDVEVLPFSGEYPPEKGFVYQTIEIPSMVPYVFAGIRIENDEYATWISYNGSYCYQRTYFSANLVKRVATKSEYESMMRHKTFDIYDKYGFDSPSTRKLIHEIDPERRKRRNNKLLEIESKSPGFLQSLAKPFIYNPTSTDETKNILNKSIKSLDTKDLHEGS